MLNWTVAFTVLALIAGILGFGEVTGGATGFAKVLFFVFLMLLDVSLIFGLRPNNRV